VRLGVVREFMKVHTKADEGSVAVVEAALRDLAKAGATLVDPGPGGALFPGDALQVVMDRRHGTFMYSYPNYLPMKPSDVRAIRSRLEGYAFEDVFGFTWGRNIIGGGRRAVDESFEHYLKAVSG